MDHFPKSEDIAWAAGLFEGEGCIYLAGDKRPTEPYMYPGLQLSMTDRDVVEKFHAIVGVGTVNIDRRKESNRSDMWRWQCANRKGFEHVMNLLGPYLGERRTTKLAQVRAGATQPRNARNRAYV